MANKDTKTLASRGNPATLRRAVEKHVADGWEVVRRTAVEVHLERAVAKPKKAAAPAVAKQESQTEKRK